MKTPSKVDVAIIGAGISGLTAGALLSQAGLRVAVVEAEPRPGGYLAGFERRGFTFDTAIQWLNQCQPGGLCYKLFQHLGGGAPECKPLTRIRRYKGESFDYVLTNEPHRLREQLIEDFPSEAAGIRRFFAHAQVLGDRLQLLNRRMRAIETMSLWEKTGFGLRMLHWVLPVWKHLKISAEQGLDRYFKSDELKKVFCSEDTMMSVIVPVAWAFNGDIQAPPAGGSQAIVDWMCERIRSSGSQLLLKHRVASIRLRDGRAAGLSLDTGETIDADYVVAACDLETVYEKMLPAGVIPEPLLRKLREADLYYSTVSVFLGLDCDAARLGFDEELVCVTRDDVSRADHSSGDPHKTSLIVIAPSVRDPELAPKGKGTLTIHCPAFLDYAQRWNTDGGRGRGEAYRTLKRAYADTLIDRVAKALAPELRAHIEVLEIATPVTYQRYTGNREGSIMGAKPTNKNIKARLAHFQTAVPNLLLAGHWAEYGGGLPVAMKSAANTSLMILKQCRPDAYHALRDVFDRA